MGAAANTNELDIVVSYTDTTYMKVAPWVMKNEHSFDANTNGTNPVTLIAAPAVNHSRLVLQYTIYNKDDTAADVIVQYNNNGVVRIISNNTLDSSKTLIFSGNDLA